MSQNIFKICNIVANDPKDYQCLLEHLSKFPVNLIRDYNAEEALSHPTILVGWEYTKEKFPTLNIFDKKIQNNLYWTYSQSEDEKLFLSEIEDFFYIQLKKWLPQDFIYFDSLLDENFKEFCNRELNKENSLFVYFDNGALYARQGMRNYIINIKSLSLTEKSFRESITEFMNNYKVIAFSYKNFCEYINIDKINEIITIENIRWVHLGVDTNEKYFNIIPNFDIQKYIPFFMSKLNSINLDQEEVAFLKRMHKRDLVTHWLSSRELAFKEDFNNNKLDFKFRKGYKLSKINYSDKRTITGRVMAHDYYNPQVLQKDNEDRSDIITRFEGGKILVYDYTSFETRIALLKCKNKEYVEKYKDSDLHYESSKILYNKDEISEEERDFCKVLNHAILYGAGEETLLKKLSIFDDPGYKLYLIRQFLSPLIQMANEMREKYSDRGYLVNEWGSIIRIDKVHASFNNYIQSIASEIVVDKVWEIRELLKGKMSQFMFQVHDSLVFDLHPSENYLIHDIGEILSTSEGLHLTLAYKLGDDYKNLSENIIYID